MKSQDTYSQGVEEILRAPSPTLHPSPDFPHSPSDGDWIGQRLHPMLSPPSCCLRTDSNAREDHTPFNNRYEQAYHFACFTPSYKH